MSPYYYYLPTSDGEKNNNSAVLKKYIPKVDQENSLCKQI